MGRQALELVGRQSAGIVDETPSWYKVKVLNAFEMYVMKDDESVTPCLVNDGFWESWITSWVIKNLDEETLFIDIGANTGYYSFIAVNKGARAIAFEPNPRYVEMMKASILGNFVSNNKSGELLPPGHFNVYERAISDREGRVTLTIPSALQGSATIRDVDLSAYDPYSIQVNAVTLDSQLAAVNGKMLIKVDAEAAEEMVWDGASETRVRNRPVWMIEYTPGAYGKDFLTKLESYGRLMWINHSGDEEPVTKGQIIAHGDWLMLVVRPY